MIIQYYISVKLWKEQKWNSNTNLTNQYTDLQYIYLGSKIFYEGFLFLMESQCKLFSVIYMFFLAHP
jgi:hypothetical protein